MGSSHFKLIVCVGLLLVGSLFDSIGQSNSPAVTDLDSVNRETARLIAEANGLWLKGDASNGIPKYEHLLGEIEKTFGKDSSVAGMVLFRIGFLYGTQGNFEQALPKLERSLRLVEPLPDDESSRLTKANLYWGLGMCYRDQLMFSQSIQAFEQALRFKESLKGKNDPDLVATLTAIADLHIMQLRPLEAMPLLERALKINEKAFGSESAEAAEMMAWLGKATKAAQDFDASLGYLKRSLDINERVLAPTNDAVASALGNLGSLYLDWGQYSEAIPLLERSVAMHAKNLVSRDVLLAYRLSVALNNLGVAQVRRGDYEKGISTLQRSLVVTETNFGSASINLGAALNAMAVAFQERGDFERALPMLERALRILEVAPPHKAAELVDSINNLAALYRDAGDDATALRLFNRSKNLAEARFGSEHLSVAYSLNGIALIAQQRGDTAEALAAFERALAILEKYPGRSQGEVGGILNNISALLYDIGDTNRALSTLQTALTMQEKVLPPKHPAIAVTLNNLAMHFSKRGDIAQAQEMYRQSLAITDAAFGQDNPDSCERLENLGIIEILARDWAGGLGRFVESSRRWRRYLAAQAISNKGLGTVRTQQKTQSSRDLFHSLCGAGGSSFLQVASRPGAEQLAFGKALLEEVETVRARLKAGGRIQVQSLMEEADSIRQRLKAIAYPDSAAWLQARTDWRNSERDKLERDLKASEERIVAASELVALTIREGNLSLIQITHTLPPDAVLIDLVQYRRTDFTAGDNQWKEQRYAAYLTFPLARDSTNVVVERVDLGEAAHINEAVELLCKRMSAGQFAAKDLPPALQRLSDLVYAPLARHLTNVSHLVVCPDGQLSRLPFEALPCGHDGNKFLVEEKTISYVTSGREVVRIAGPKSKAQSLRSAARSSKSLVMGNPDFNLDLRSSRREEALTKKSAIGNPKSEIEVSLLTLSPTRALSRDFQGLKFNPLPGSGVEATNVAKLLGENAALRLGSEAREAELKVMVSPRVLHLATHGFFLSDQEILHANSGRAELLAGLETRSPQLGVGANRIPAKDNWENPLVRCGIALAGANHFTNSFFGRAGTPLPAASSSTTNGAHGVTRPTIETEEDGLLTGLEASLLNLQGTELVVLSACDSGTGELKIGEGVMSLRRAFRIAGAETVLASHWPVSDKATSRLMTEFMRRWRAGEPRAKAWREAQLSLLHSKEFSNPYFWSAFTLTGQWN